MTLVTSLYNLHYETKCSYFNLQNDLKKKKPNQVVLEPEP